ncbi:MAG: sigma-70 family RNA polymerase sigma factor [Clostridia bacterium]|nr:sigma-70 family RNA polymerase sigma factor [Clostridia bacterium]
MTDIYTDFLQLDDRDLIQQARGGDREALNALMERYKTMVKAKARGYYIAGADMEDTIQEGMIGLYNAYASYDEDKDASFKTFATLCVERAMVSAVRKATAISQIPVEKVVSISDQDGEGLEEILEDGKSGDPEEIYLRKSHTQMLHKYAEEHLSSKELQVLRQYLQGNSQSEIAEILGISRKSVDNALSRIKGKLVKTNGKE